MSPVNNNQDQGAASANIKIEAQGYRRDLEHLYLELRQLAQQEGLKIEYQLTVKKSEE